MRKLLMIMLGVLVMGAAVAAPAAKEAEATAETKAPGVSQLDQLRMEIDELLTMREQAIAEHEARYREADLSERTALEAEGGALIRDFDRAYFELVVEYQTLAGNESKAERAQAQIDQIDAGVVTGVPLDRAQNTGAETSSDHSSTGGPSHD